VLLLFQGKVIPNVYVVNALVTTYETILEDKKILRQIKWRVCIIEEAKRSQRGSKKLKNQTCKLLELLQVRKAIDESLGRLCR
jgi:SNF2 family DNA or RNA helicase